MNSSDPSPNQAARAVPPIESSQVVAQLARILSSERFVQSPRSAAFLKFVVEETLNGRSDFIKSRTIGLSVFQRSPGDNPQDDPIVRIQAGRLRRALDQYYAGEGVEDSIRVFIPTGAYVPVFRTRPIARADENAGVAAGSPGRRASLPRIAVLPLVNQSGSPEYDYFAEGLGEELSAQFARFQGLAVVAYWTTSQMRRDPLDMVNVGRDLDVDFIVTGSLARSGDRVRVRIQCVQVETGEQVWAEGFDRRLTTDALFDIQDEIVRHVVACVGDSYGSVPQTLFRASREKPAAELTAYEAILANHHYVRCLDQPTRDHTRAALEGAVESEPSYALAWAMLSALYCDIHAYDFSAMDAPLARAEHCVQRAMALDQNCQHAHYASAYVATLGRDHPRVIAACDNIVRLNPNAAFMVGAASIWLGIAGRFDRAFPLLERSLELNPYHPGWFHILPWLDGFTDGDYRRALAAAHQFNMPGFFWDPLLRASCLGKLGRTMEAEAALEQLVDLCPNFAARPDDIVGCYVHADDTREDVLDGLRVARLGRT